MNRKGFKMINAIKHPVFRGCFFHLKLAEISYFRAWLNLRYVKKGARYVEKCFRYVKNLPRYVEKCFRYVKKGARYVENGGKICQK